MTHRIILKNKLTNEDVGYWHNEFKYREDAINSLHEIRSILEKSNVYPDQIEYIEDEDTE